VSADWKLGDTVYGLTQWVSEDEDTYSRDYNTPQTFAEALVYMRGVAASVWGNFAWEIRDYETGTRLAWSKDAPR